MAIVDSTVNLLAQMRRAPLSTAASLMHALRLGSQASISRVIRRAGPQVLAIGQARARRYAAARDVRGLGIALPLFRVDREGTVSIVAEVRTFEPMGYWIDAPTPLPRWMRGAKGDHVFPGLPVFLADQRPQGFLGRAYARRHAALGVPDNPRDWSDDDAFLALAMAGEDGIGDLILGNDSVRRLYAAWAESPALVRSAIRAVVYPEMAEQAIAGAAPGSSAGGEQPKFGAIVNVDGAPTHVLVKFSPSGTSPNATRWRDLLLAENTALHMLRHEGLPGAESEIVHGGSRVFLQTRRFDRIGMRGRVPVVTLWVMNAEYIGMAPGAGHWLDAVRRMEADRWLSPAAVSQVRALQWFGRFIANTDMHFANLSFLPRADGMLDVAPAYDMLPMNYAPVGNELPPRQFVPPLPEPGEESNWFEAADRGIAFWAAVAREPKVSKSFRAIATDNATAIRNAVTQFRGRR